ncbi:Low temperature viability protein-domain-containing protein [Cubamyces menziesii]|nr:Low temperature viability protein-domain-containing protein [Cubamyces menziesii]
MPPKSIFRQPGAQHFQVVHRSQRDPLIHDPEASKHVLKPVQRSNLKGKSRADLEQLLSPAELAHDKARPNIGEAALYGIYYDDTDYDYMQHLKPVGLQEDGVDSMWVEAPTKSQSKGKGKDALALLGLPEDALASKSELPRNYEAQENIPSSIAGFQPDLDPHLRQVLEALEDDAFVDEGLEDDFFGELVKDGERAPDEHVEFEFREEGLQDGDAHAHDAREGGDDAEDESWEARFARFKQAQKSAPQEEGSDLDTYSEGADTVGTLPRLPVIGGKRRRKGTSDASGYSMSSSSMWRNEHLTVLDERFDQIQREYEDSDEDDDEEASLGDLDEAPDLIASREDFESMMDEFLEKYEVISGKMRPVLPGTATEKLDTIRKALGEAKIRDDAESEPEDDDILMPLDIDDKKDRWDCETILTTYSNLENHPRLIRARSNKPVPKIRLDPKTGLPSVSEEPSSKKQSQLDSATDEEDDPRPARVTIARKKDETPEEKKARKQAVKAERQARRTEKKATRESFSKEVKRQVQSLADKEKTKVRKL